MASRSLAYSIFFIISHKPVLSNRPQGTSKVTAFTFSCKVVRGCITVRVFLIALGVYFILPKACRNYWLFIVIIVFYGWGEPVFVLVMLISIFPIGSARLLSTSDAIVPNAKNHAHLFGCCIFLAMDCWI